MSNKPAVRESQQPATLAVKAQQRTLELLQSAAPEIRRALGSRGDVEKFVRAARSHYLHTTAEQRDAMALVSPESYVAACIDAATTGLLPNGRDAYIYPRGKKAVFHPSWRGLVTLVRRASQIEIAAECVFERCRFRVSLGTQRRLDHEPYYALNVDEDDRGELVAAYATAEHDGRTVFRVLSRAQLDKRQRLGGPVWKQHYEAMCMKSAIRALCDWLPIPDELRDLIKSDSDNDRDDEPTVMQTGPRALPAEHAAPTGDPATGWNGGQTSAAGIRARAPKKPTTPAPIDAQASEPAPPASGEPENAGELFDDVDAEGGAGEAP